MKLHLPVSLFRSVVFLMTAVPTALYAAYTAPTEIDVPDNYTNAVELSGAVEMASQEESTVYRLTDDITISPNAFAYSGVSYLYTSDSADKLASVAFTKPSGSTKLACSLSTQVTFDSLKDVSFTSFASTGIYGGAVSVNRTGNILFSNNESVSYNSNKVAQKSGNAANGGAVHVEGTASFRDNGELIFHNNEAQSQGGAVSLDKKRDVTTDKSLVFSGNDSVTFSSNRTGNSLAGLGGALYNILGCMELNHNGNLTFSSNTARATYMSQGGAIYSTANGGSGLALDLCYNDSLSFTNNLAQSGNYNASDGNALGGAILASGTDVRLNGNGSLVFKGNKAYTTKSNWVAEGGAIRIGYNSSLSIQNNGSVVFEDNKTQVGSVVKYNSIYADDSAVQYNGTIKTYKLDVNISAPEEGSVEFRDCVYIDVSQHEESSFKLNSKYIGEDGKEIAQTGDIIFTGSYMSDGDKTSEFKGTASLHDGRLVVKDGAVLKAGNLVVAESASGESAPTVVVENAVLSANQLSFAAGTVLVNNNGVISGTEGITVNGGVVKGCGTFGSLSLSDSELVVGNSPGYQSYEGDLVLSNTEVVFSLGDFTTPASEGEKGWDSAAYSVIDMNGHELVLGEDVTFTFELGGNALEQLLDSTSGEIVSFSLEFFRNVGTLTLDNKSVEDLIAGAEFVITSDEAGLGDGRYAAWAGKNITDQVTAASIGQDGGDMVLSIAMKTASVPEPTSATLSLLALCGLVARRRRK